MAVIFVDVPEHIVGLTAVAVTTNEPTVIGTDAVALQAPFIAVTVYVVLVAGIAKTLSPVVTFNPVEGDHEYVVPPLATSVTESPVHIPAEGGVTVTVGVGVTVTVTLSLAIQPPPLVPTTVYVIVLPGPALTTAPVVVFKPVDGLHEYVFAPLAVNVTLSPEHTDVAEGVTVTVGEGNTLITTESVLEQPFALVPVTVYVVVEPGVAIT